jgi:hypothetical protein
MWSVSKNTVVAAMLLAAVLATRQAQANEPTSYVCVVDQATGFKFQGNQWQMANFIPEKFVFKWGRVKPEGKEAWLLRGLGEEFVSAVCHDYVLGWEDNRTRGELIQCDGRWITARMRKNTLRLLIAYTAGFVSGEDATDGNTPYIAIGKCSPL